MEQLAPLNLGNLALKCKSKKEMYDVLLNDCGVYLPPIEYANASYIRNIMTGKVDFIKTSNVILIQVPHIKSLAIKDIMTYARNKFNLDNYLPKYTKFRYPNRPWLCNIISTVLKDNFKEWIEQRMSEREKVIVNKKRFNVNVLPEFVNAIKKSNRISLTGGRSHFLLRQPTHKRMKIEEVKEIVASQNKLDIENAELFSQIQDLKEKCNEYRMMHQEDLKYKDAIDKLIEDGVINDDGILRMQF